MNKQSVVNAILVLVIVSSAMSFASELPKGGSGFVLKKAKDIARGAFHAGKYSAGIGTVAAMTSLMLSSKKNMGDELKFLGFLVGVWTVPAVVAGSGIGLVSTKDISKRARIAGIVPGVGAAMTIAAVSASLATAEFFYDVVTRKCIPQKYRAQFTSRE
jgi:hypothetical protein